jgi:hypothetical protein
MTAGSWIYIGTQGILQGTYETFGACARAKFGGSLKGRLVVTGGLGGMGGAQPLAATFNEGVCLVAEVDRARIEKRTRLQTRYLDKMTASMPEAIEWALAAKKSEQAVSIGVLANIADLLAELIKRNITPDVLTDQTSAHDPVDGYVPNGMTYEAALELRRSDRVRYERESFRTMAEHIASMLELQHRGAVTFDYGNNLRGHAVEAVKRGLHSPVHAKGTDSGQGHRQSEVGNRNSFPSTFGPCSAKAPDPSAGRRFPVIRKTSPAPIGPCWRPSPTMNTWPAGSSWPVKRWLSRDCPRDSAGSVTANGPGWGWFSMTWWPGAKCPLRS